MFSISSVDDISIELIDEMVNFDFQKNLHIQNSLAVLFFQEPSTRTKESFRIACEQFNVPIVDVLPEISSVKKGETLKQTLSTLSNYTQKTVCIWHGETIMMIYAD